LRRRNKVINRYNFDMPMIDNEYVFAQKTLTLKYNTTTKKYKNIGAGYSLKLL